MAAGDEYTTKIKVEADTSGAAKTADAFERVDKKAKALTQSVGGVTKAVGLMRRAFAGFGMIGLITTLVAAVEKLRKAFSDSAGEAEKLRKEMEKAADTERIDKLTASYEKLTKAIEASAKARKDATELEDLEKFASREREDIDAQAAKDAELAALDPNDPLYEQRKAQIEAKYSGQAANRAAQRKVEDAETAAARTAAEAEAKGEEAGLRRAALIDDRSQLDVLKARRSAALVQSLGKNDLSGGAQLWTDFTRLLGMNGGWGKLGSYSTEEGDARRKEQEEKVKELDAAIKVKEKDIADKESKIAELESEAAHLSQKSIIQSSMAENAKDAASVTRAQSYRGEAAAAAALSGRIDTENDAKRAKELLERQKAETEARIEAQRRRAAQADANVAAAQGDLTMYQSQGNSREAGTAAQRLARAQGLAGQTKSETNMMISALTETLGQINSLLAKTTATLRKDNSQRLTAQAQALTTP